MGSRSPSDLPGLPGTATYHDDMPAGVRRPTAAFFDLDKTIIARSSSFVFSKPFQAGGLISRRAMLRSAYAQFVYLVGGADHDQMEKMRQFMSQLLHLVVVGATDEVHELRVRRAQHRAP